MTLREDLNRDGYVVIRELFDCDSLADLSVDEDYFSALLNSDPERYIRLMAALAKGDGLQRTFLRIDAIYELGLLSPIICEQPVYHIMSPKLKIPGGYYGTEAHQDWPSVQGSLDMVTVWIALTDAKIGNFPLEIIPGSHKQGLREGRLNGSVLEIECNDKEFVPIECNAGDVIIFSGFTIHRTGKGDGFRLAASQRFDNADEPSFIERGYPCAQKRVVDREIKWKPTIDQVRNIYA